jgi:hypothetical protein
MTTQMLTVFRRRRLVEIRGGQCLPHGRRTRFGPWVVALFVIAAGAGLLAQREPLPYSAPDADRFERTLAAIAQLGFMSSRPGVVPMSVRTAIREAEVNAYLRYRFREQLPAGVIDAFILALGDGRLVGRADVDLDAVRESRQRSLLDPIRFLRGRMPISATGVLRTQDGIGRFELESAKASGVPIPRQFLQELVTFYWGTAANPVGFNLDAPFDLPMGIREIQVLAGQAVIVQ